MGKYRYDLQNAIEMRKSNMETSKSYHSEQDSYYDDQVFRLLPYVLDEMMEELTQRFDFKVENLATPALKELDQQIKSLGQ